MNPDTIGYVWTGEYDLNTLRVDGEIFESGTKKLRIPKYPDTRGQGLKHVYRWVVVANGVSRENGSLVCCCHFYLFLLIFLFIISVSFKGLDHAIAGNFSTNQRVTQLTEISQ